MSSKLALAGLGLAAAVQELTLFDTSTGALCTDGTPSGYYFEKSKTGSKKWVIWIQGGGLCQSNADCVSRQGGDLGTSSTWSKTQRGAQLQSTDASENPDFHEWNMLYLKYCSGDVWTGTQAKPTDPWAAAGGAALSHDLRYVGGSARHASVDTASDSKFSFTGHTNLAVAVAEAKAHLGLAAATDVVLTGCSAGGIGTFYNADWLASQFDAAQTKVVGNPQAGWFGLDINDYDDWVHGKPNPDPHYFNSSSWLMNIDQMHVPGQGDAIDRCLAADPSAGLQLCSSVPRMYPFTETPLFVSENTADSYQVFAQGGAPQTLANATTAYVDYLHGILAGSLHVTVIGGKKKAMDGLYSPACLAHCLQFSGDKAPLVAGKTHQQAVGDWYFGRGDGHFLINDSTDVNTLLSCTDIQQH